MEWKANKLHGFTLVELIMVITVISVLATMFASLFGVAIKAYKVMESRNDLILEGGITLREIARSIRLARWVEGTLPLSGATELTVMSDFDKDDAVERVRYYHVPGTKELRRQTDGVPAGGVLLAKNVDEVSFSGGPELFAISLRLSRHGEEITMQTSAGGEWW
jgi:prepilin-type N-terminal cleavage/methylation domain-containing protein